MTFEMNQPRTVTVDTVYIRYVTRDEKKPAVLRIEADTGRLLSHEDGFNGRFHEKVVDTGEYELWEANGNRVSFLHSYVPSWIPGEFGDYINIEVENGVVKHWHRYFNKERLEEYFS